jgi:acyl-CoA oxidase
MQLVGKGLLTEFNQSFHEDKFSAVMNYIRGKLRISLAEMNLYYARKTSTEHILDDEFLSQALRYNEKKMLISLADRMRDYIDKKVSPYEAFLKCQVHLIDAARAYIERLAYREMIKTLDTLEDSSEKQLLYKINRFYALSLIMEHRYFYLESDYMDGSKTKAIRRVYSDVMLDLKNNVKEIIDSFGIDDNLIEIKP